MFAVPGWSVPSSALKKQAEPAPLPPQNDSQPAKEAAKSKKRKRINDNVTTANVEQMYQHVIEAKNGKPNAEKNGAVKSVKAKKGKKEGKPRPGNAAESSTKGERTEQGKDNSALNAKPLEGEDANEYKRNKRQKKNKEDKKKQEQGKDEQQNENNAKPNPTSTGTPASEAVPIPPEPPGLTPLQQAMRQKLISARFRHLNETLYTTDSKKAMELFGSNPELFNEYHAGFSLQVKESWPSNPVDGYIRSIQSRGKVPPAPKKSNNEKRLQTRPLPRRSNGLCTIADLGCGDARLARTLTPSAKKLNLNLLSYDLQAPDPLITKADVSNLPVPDGSVDIAIFCLSLMGTNWVSFVEEAWRVLRSDGKGECWVSEVKSRFGKVIRKKAQIGAKKPLSRAEKKKLKKKNKRGDDDDDGSDVDDAEVYAEDARPSDNDETDISAFVDVFRARGFILKPESVDKSNKMFVTMEFVKQGGPPTRGKYATVAGSGVGPGKKKFIEKTDESRHNLLPEEEAKVLKPCVYKIR